MAGGDLTVHQAIGEMIAELEGIGKGGYNREQKYYYRGIEDVLRELHPLFAKYGVFMAPDVLERHYEERVSTKGTLGHAAHLHVRFTVYGPTGDSISLSTWGEGLDYSDKATNKAMTAAFKYALFQLFAVCDPAEDGDAQGPESGTRRGSDERLAYLVAVLTECGLPRSTQKAILEAALGHAVTRVETLEPGEIELSITAIESAVADVTIMKSAEAQEEYPW